MKLLGVYLRVILLVVSTTTHALKEITETESFRVRDQTGRIVPRFMTELYNGSLKNISVLDGTVVRSFRGQSSGSFHFFNLTSFRQDERVIKAEVRWFHHQRPFMARHQFYKVDLYEVLDRRSKPWRGNLISSRSLPVYSKGWEVFDVTQTVSTWILHSRTNNSILLVTALPNGQSDETDVYLVIYSDDGRKHHQPLYTGRRIDTSLAFLDPVESLMKSAKRSRRSASVLTSTCQRTNLYVDFDKMGWSGWIISPRVYNAYGCAGACPFPLGEGLRATNHATVRSIMSALKLPQWAGQPCCVPDALHPISILYFDDEENVVLKQYNDMVAGSCGCH